MHAIVALLLLFGPALTFKKLPARLYFTYHSLIS